MALLEAKKLGISFGGLRAVDDFNISIEKGELYGLIGPNGAGKTTVFNLLTGVYKPTEGIITLDGKDITGKKTIDIARIERIAGNQTVSFESDVGDLRVSSEGKPAAISTQQVVPHKNVGDSDAGEFQNRGGDIDLRCGGRVLGRNNAISMDDEGNPCRIGKSAAVHGGNVVLSKGKSMVGQNDEVCIFIPRFVLYGSNEACQLPVCIIHGDLNSFGQGLLFIGIGHSRCKIKRVMI